MRKQVIKTHSLIAGIGDENNYTEIRCSFPRVIALRIDAGVQFTFRASQVVRDQLAITPDGKWVNCKINGVYHAAIIVEYTDNTSEQIPVDSIIKPQVALADEPYVNALDRRREQAVSKDVDGYNVKLPDGQTVHVAKFKNVLPTPENETRFDDAPLRGITTGAIKVHTSTRRNNWKDADITTTSGCDTRGLFD